MEGRSSDEIRRTLSIVSSTRLIISFSLFRVLAGGRGLLCNQERSSFRAVKAWPNSSWISRAIRILSSSRTASRRAAKPRSCSPDVRRDSSARLFSEISRITSVVVVVATTVLSPVRLKVCGEPKLNWYHLSQSPLTPRISQMLRFPERKAASRQRRILGRSESGTYSRMFVHSTAVMEYPQRGLLSSEI